MELNEKYKKKVFSSTISESKGMEFEIVIIYNFFKNAGSIELNLWQNILNHLKIEKTENHNILNIMKELEFEEIKDNIKDEIYNAYKEKLNLSYKGALDDELRHKLFNMCAELKELYVAITRAKTCLFFYDEDLNIYPLFCKILKNLNIISKDNNQEESTQYAIDYLYEHLLDEKEFKLIAEDNFKTGNYKKAEFYFNILKDKKMEIQSSIYLKFEELQKMESKQEKSHELENMKNELHDLINNNINLLGDLDILGNIYIYLKEYEKAMIFFENKKDRRSCGIVYKLKKQYKEAYKIFEEIKEHGLAIECLILSNNYIKLFNYIKQHKEIFDLEHFTDYFKKYANGYLINFQIKSILSDKITTITKNEEEKEKNKDKKEKNKEEKEKEKNKVDKFKIIFDDKIIDSPFKKELFLKFPKVNDYIKNYNYYGLNAFNEIHFNNSITKEKRIKYLVADKYQNNIFLKTKDNNISKSREEIIKVFDNFVKLLDFILDYICFRKDKLEENIAKDINKQFKKMNELIKLKIEYQNNFSKSNEDLKDLISVKIENKDLIYKVIKDWKLKKNTKEIIDTQLLKTNLVPYLIGNFPLLIMYKRFNLEYISISKINNEELLSKTFKELVNICKQLPIEDKKIIEALESSMILCGHFKIILPFLSQETLFLFASIFKKSKIFFKCLNEDKIMSFMPYNLEKGIFVNNDNYFFIFSSFLSINICNYFKSRAKFFFNIYDNNSKNDDICNKNAIEAINNLKEYPKIYNLLYKLESNFQKQVKLMSSSLQALQVPFPFSLYINYFSDFLKNYHEKNETYTDSEIIKLIEIGNTISLYIAINSLKSVSYSKNDIKNNSELYEISRLLIKLKELLLVHNKIEYKFIIILFSLFNTLGITLLPETKKLQVYNIFPCGVLNHSSIINWSREDYSRYLNISNKISLFESTAKNTIIFYNSIFSIFNEITHKVIIKIFHNENPFFCCPVYNFLDINNLEKYFDLLLYNYSFHRRKYLNDICSLMTFKDREVKDNKNNMDNKDNNLFIELKSILKYSKAEFHIFEFGMYKDFCRTLCNWPRASTSEEVMDCIFCPFYRWEEKIDMHSILNFTQITIILGELPMPFEKLSSLNDKTYNKGMNLIFDINENLYNDILYLYCKEGKEGTYKKEEIERIFINYILFSFLIYNYTGYQYSQFYVKDVKIDSLKDIFTAALFKLLYNDRKEKKENNQETKENIQGIKENIQEKKQKNKDKFENGQQVFPSKLILDIFNIHEDKIAKLLKIIWIKKLLPLIIYTIKKNGYFEDDNEKIPIFEINEKTIEFDYFNDYNILLTKEDILLYLKILNNFILKETSISSAERKFKESLLNNLQIPKKEQYKKRLSRPYLQNYIELQLYLIILSIKKISEIGLKDDDISLKIKEIIDESYLYDFYYKNILIDLNEFEKETKFVYFGFNEKNKIIKNHIKIVKAFMSEKEINSQDVDKKIEKKELKEIMYKNIFNERYLFINNNESEKDEIINKCKFKGICKNDLINYLYVPLKKETIPQYQNILTNIYNNFW